MIHGKFFISLLFSFAMGKIRVLGLLSGGFDSPVALRLLIEKGAEVGAVNFSFEPFTDKKEVEKAEALGRKIGISEFFVVDIGKVLVGINKKIDNRYYFIIMRRLMLRIAERIAMENGYEYLATGENLGQVGSQTLKNLVTISECVKLPILRPVLCNDKEETLRKAKETGTYELSLGPEICCLLGPKNPATSSMIERIKREEEKFDADKAVEEALKSLRKTGQFSQNI